MASEKPKIFIWADNCSSCLRSYAIPDNDASGSISASTMDSSSGSQYTIYTCIPRNSTHVFYLLVVLVVCGRWWHICEFLLTNSVHHKAESPHIYLTMSLSLLLSYRWSTRKECSLFSGTHYIFFQCFRRAFDLVSINSERINNHHM